MFQVVAGTYRVTVGVLGSPGRFLGLMGPLVEPRRGPQGGKSRDPRSQDADSDA